jgi:hypothetical protein
MVSTAVAPRTLAFRRELAETAPKLKMSDASRLPRPDLLRHMYPTVPMTTLAWCRRLGSGGAAVRGNGAGRTASRSRNRIFSARRW